MAIRILTLPFDPTTGSFDDEPLSDFLRGKHIQRIEPHFFQQDGRGFWTILVEYTPVLDDPPVRGRDAEVLSDTEQRLFDELRVYLDPLDHFVKEQLRVRHYLRYMDDLVLFGDSKLATRRWHDAIDEFLTERLCLTLNPTSTWINRASHGLSFLGHRIFPNLIRVHSKSRRRSLRNLKRRHKQWCAGTIDDRQWQNSLASITGYHRFFAGTNPLLYPRNQ